MLIVKTYLKDTGKKGIGLFAGERIEKERVFWVLDSLFEIRITRQQYESLAPLQREYVDVYGFFLSQMDFAL